MDSEKIRHVPVPLNRHYFPGDGALNPSLRFDTTRGWTVRLDDASAGVSVPEHVARIIFRGALEQAQYDTYGVGRPLPEKSDPYSCFSVLLLAAGVTMPQRISDSFNFEHIEKLFPLAKERPGISSLETTLRSYKHFPIGVALYTENVVPEHAFLVLGIDDRDRIVCFDKAGKYHYNSYIGGYSIRTPQHIMRGYPNAKYISLRRL